MRVAQEAIAATGYGDDPSLLARFVGEGLAQRRDLHLDVVLLDHDAGPYALHELVLRHEVPVGLE